MAASTEPVPSPGLSGDPADESPLPRGFPHSTCNSCQVPGRRDRAGVPRPWWGAQKDLETGGATYLMVCSK